MKKSEKVYIVGAGPGDPELLTVKALRLLTSYAEVVIHDRLISPELLSLIPANVERIFAGKEPELHHMTQENINDVLVEKARQGKKTVRLKGGDPFIFGRGGEEAEYLKENGVEFEIVPGITSAIGAAAELALPLTYRKISEGLILITGHTSEDDIPDLDYELLASTKYTIAIYMGVKNISTISQKLIKNGRSPSTYCVVICQATNKSSCRLYSTLSELASDMKRNDIKNPAMIYIGDVVKISQELSSL